MKELASLLLTNVHRYGIRKVWEGKCQEIPALLPFAVICLERHKT